MLAKLLRKPSFYLVSLIGLIIVRAFFNVVFPLTDKTEARYAEIAIKLTGYKVIDKKEN